MMPAEDLKLIVTDAEDLTMLSALLQDATVLIGDMGYDDGQFMMVAARFIADESSSDEGEAPRGQRRLMGINFSSVTAIKRKGFSLGQPDDVLNLLTIRRNDTSIDVVFSGAAMLRLECQAIRIYAADLGEGWVTSFRPWH
jgi:hypothetical protein